MRIIGGIHKGKRLQPPKKLPVRPTTDFAKEGLFNVLRNRIEIVGMDVLDLCAGTGNLSLEFASRGAKSVTAVDQHYLCLKYILQIATELNLDSIKTIKSEMFRFVKKVDQSFDIIFLDPPYGIENTEKLPELIFDQNILNTGGLLILEHDANYNFSEEKNFSFSKKYGNVNFTFFEQMNR